MIKNQMIQISQCEQPGLGVFTAPASQHKYLWLGSLSRNEGTKQPTISILQTEQDFPPLVSQQSNERHSDLDLNLKIEVSYVSIRIFADEYFITLLFVQSYFSGSN